jgi:hypothetical protein
MMWKLQVENMLPIYSESGSDLLSIMVLLNNNGVRAAVFMSSNNGKAWDVVA